MRRFGMKKMAALVLAAGLTAAVPMQAYAWGFSFGGTKTEAKEEESYVFASNGTQIVMGAEAAPILKGLGTPSATFEQDSCAYQGKDKVYSYSGFEVSTYPSGGKDLIASVYVLDDTVSTPEGLKLGSKYDDMVKAYGKSYKEENGVYRYTKGDSELAVYTTGKVVDAIEYTVITE